MFNTGLEFVRADFHLHTCKDKEFSYSGEQNSFVNDYVSALKTANVSVGVVANHNKFDKDEYKAIKKAAIKKDIYILPGVELTIKEGANGIHTLIIFNPDEWLKGEKDHIQTFLAEAFATIHNPENSNAKSVFDLKTTFEHLEAYGNDYFIIFAHVDQNSGLFRECKGGLLESLAELAPFRKRVLGLQKSRTRDKINQFKRCFHYVPALVEGSDPKSITEIGKGDKFTYLKIGEYSYSAVKFALQDHKNRVSETISNSKRGYIDSISFQGGKFDGQTIKFSNQLNTLIGIRGSGKSSVIETIRYALGISAHKDVDKKYKDELVKNILGSGGKVTLDVVDKYGKKYLVSRINGEQVNVISEDSGDLNIDPLSLLDGVQYFGQKDLSSSADHEIGLLENLVSGKIGHPPNIEQCVDELTATAERLLNVNKLPLQIADIELRQTELKHKLSIFKEKGVADKLKKQSGYATDKIKIRATQNKASTILNELRSAYENNSVISNILDEYNSEFNKDLFDEVNATLSLIDSQLIQIGSCISQIELHCNDLNNIFLKLKERMDNLADEFAEIKREIKDDTLDADDFVKMTTEIEKVKDKLKRLEEEASSKSKIEASFSKSVRERNERLSETFNIYKAETERINGSQSELCIEITFKGDKDGFKAQMKTDFRGTGITDNKYQAICDKFSDYTSIIENWILHDGDELKKIVSTSEYAKLDERLKLQYKELLKQQVQNKVDIYYHGKLLRQHSIGQRASALILFILTQDSNDVILIDQPEDDLDNKVIYEEVITTIIQKKPYMQFIFATHNANIPVLGDSERVLVTEFQETKIDVSQGNIDLESTHRQIVDIMEGGKEAFAKRQLIYTSWE